MRKPDFQPHDDEHPVGAQIFDNDMSMMIKAAKDLQDAGYDIIDLNFSCPTPKVVSRKRGGWLMNDPDIVLENLLDYLGEQKSTICKGGVASSTQLNRLLEVANSIPTYIEELTPKRNLLYQLIAKESARFYLKPAYKDGTNDYSQLEVMDDKSFLHNVMTNIESTEDADLILSPVAPSVAPEIGASEDPLEMYKSDMYTLGVNLAGLPGISVPVGKNDEGMPIGLQLIAKAFNEKTLFNGAASMEKVVNYTK